MGLRDYRWVSDLLPGREAPMDLDCVLEKNGHFLVMEFKPEGAGIPLGQRITLRSLVKLDMDVWVVWEGRDGKHVEVGSLTEYGEVLFVEKMMRPKLANKVVEWRRMAGER